MNIIDYSVSKEEFFLKYDPIYKLYRTTPVPQELGRYYQSDAYISHTDGKKGLFEKLYQWVKTYTLQQKIKLIERYRCRYRRFPKSGSTARMECKRGRT